MGWDDLDESEDGNPHWRQLTREDYDAIVLAERERCAKIATSAFDKGIPYGAGVTISLLIRSGK